MLLFPACPPIHPPTNLASTSIMHSVFITSPLIPISFYSAFVIPHIRHYYCHFIPSSVSQHTRTNKKKSLLPLFFFFPPVDHHVLYRCTNRKRNERNDKPDKGRVDRFLLCVRFALLFSFVRWFDVLGGWMIVYKREERVFFPYCSQVFFCCCVRFTHHLALHEKRDGGSVVYISVHLHRVP